LSFFGELNDEMMNDKYLAFISFILNHTKGLAKFSLRTTNELATLIIKDWRKCVIIFCKPII
jgi:hypothetical protein